MFKTRPFRLLVLLLVVFAISCEQPQEEVQPATPAVVKDTRLHFDSKEQLASFIEEQKTKGYTTFKQLIAEKEKSGFRSLMPVFDRNDFQRLEEYKSFRLNEQTKLMERTVRYFPQLSGRIKVSEEDLEIEEDDMIADPFFAALLNRDREIVVAGKVYKFNEQGVYYANVDKYDALKKVVDNQKTLFTTPGYKSITKDVNVYVPTRIAPPVEEPCDGCGGSGGSPTPPPPPPTKEEVKNNLRVCFWDPNIWDSIFGPAEDCLDYFESDKRIKTKVWSQNYGIFASVGIKVESQNRFLRIWWADDINEVELGYTISYFEYPVPKTTWPQTKYVYHYEYGDYIIDQYGRYVGHAANGPSSLFEKFPINDPGMRMLTIYLFEPLEDVIGQSSIDLTAKHINQAVNALAKNAFKTMSSYLNKQINGPSVIVYPNKENDKVKFLFVNWYNNNANDNKIVKTFDWNSAIIGWKSKGGSGNPTFDFPSSYKKFMTIAYGMGRRGTTWKGSKVVLDDSK